MKNFLSLLFICIATYTASAQNADSIAYEAQRNKINGMLTQRTAKFGEYDESLNMRTGIFGLQTKKDIRHSNEILMDIVDTDDEILRQTKILLDYRVFQKDQAETRAKEIENTSVAYMNTINRLRNQLEETKKAADESQKELENKRKLNGLLFIIIALMAVSILAVIRRNRIFKA